MKFSVLTVFVSGIETIIAPAHTQTPSQPGFHYTLPLRTALEAAQVAIRVCEEKHYWVTATVVDMDGVPQIVMRGDHATVHTGESSFRKAFTVVTLGPEFGFDRSSGFFELVKTNPFAPQLATVHNVMALPGAVVFKANGEMVGAMGDWWRARRRQRRSLRGRRGRRSGRPVAALTSTWGSSVGSLR